LWFVDEFCIYCLIVFGGFLFGLLFCLLGEGTCMGFISPELCGGLRFLCLMFWAKRFLALHEKYIFVVSNMRQQASK
jgi:hypothetical protein